MGEQQKNELNHHSIEEDGENGGEEAEEDPPCAKHHVSAKMKLFNPGPSMCHLKVFF